MVAVQVPCDVQFKMPAGASFLKTFIQRRFPFHRRQGNGKAKKQHFPAPCPFCCLPVPALPVLLPSRSVLGFWFLVFGPVCCLPAPCLVFGFWFLLRREREGNKITPPGALPVLLPSRSLSGQVAVLGFWFLVFVPGREREGKKMTPPGALPVLLPSRSLSGQVVSKASLGKIPYDRLAKMRALVDFLKTLGSHGIRGHLSL